MNGFDELTRMALPWLFDALFTLAGFALLAISAEVPLRARFRVKGAPGRRWQRDRPGRAHNTSRTGHDHD